MKQSSEDDEKDFITSTDSLSMDTEEPLENLQQRKPFANKDQLDKVFIHSDEAKKVIDNSEFKVLYEQMQDAIALAEEKCEPPEYLPREDDENNVEYKFYMCNITFSKLERRQTQMSYRLNAGKGEAFYEVGVHDDGTPEGTTIENLTETLIVLYYIAIEKIGDSTLTLIKARLGLYEDTYSIQLRVTKPQPEIIDPEIETFGKALKTLQSSQLTYGGTRINSLIQKAPQKVLSAAHVVKQDSGFFFNDPDIVISNLDEEEKKVNDDINQEKSLKKSRSKGSDFQNNEKIDKVLNPEDSENEQLKPEQHDGKLVEIHEKVDDANHTRDCDTTADNKDTKSGEEDGSDAKSTESKTDGVSPIDCLDQSNDKD